MLTVLSLFCPGLCSDSAYNLEELSDLALVECFALEKAEEILAHWLAVELVSLSHIPYLCMLQLRERFLGKAKYLNFLFHLLKAKQFVSFLNAVKMSIFVEFEATSKLFPEVTSLFDYSLLHPFVSKGLGILAASDGNLCLFKRLVHQKLFDLNADYESSRHKGNAIVLLKRQLACLAFALEVGLDVERNVFDTLTLEYLISSLYLYYIGDKACHKLVLKASENLKKN